MKNKLPMSPFKPLITIVSRFNITIFIVIIVVALIFSIWTLSKIILPDDTTSSGVPASNSQTTTSDQSLNNRLSDMSTSSNSPASQVLPSGRINPFSE